MAAGYPRPYGRYVLEDRIAMGGMAEIFRAKTATEGFEKRVCIKRVLPHFLEDAEFVTMFRDEALVAARLQHANVVQVFDFGEEEGTLYLAMELIDGCDLRRVLDASKKRRLPLEVGEVAQIGIDVCRGLHHAHTLEDGAGRRLGIVHRDVSPHNILLSKAGEVKVTDFGIAKAAERATHTSTGIVKGKVAYMSPEQAEGRAFDHRLDQFALGVILWEALVGKRLFQGDNDIMTLKKVLACEVPPPSTLRADVPTMLDPIVLRALHREPEGRYRDMREMELALQRFLFSGVVDPSSAEVRNVFTRIMSGMEHTPRKTQMLPSQDLNLDAPPPASPAPGPDARAPSAPSVVSPREAQANAVTVKSATDEALVSSTAPSHLQSSSSGDVSSVFSSSQPHAPAPTANAVVIEITSGTGSNPLASSIGRAALVDDAAPTMQEVSRSNLPDSDVQQRGVQQPLVAASMKPRMASAPSKPASRMPVNTVVAEPLQTGLSVDNIDVTPATRTLVPAQEASASVQVVVDRSPPLEATRTGSGALVVPRDRTPLWAAGGVVAVLAATAGVVLVMRGDAPTPPLATEQPAPTAALDVPAPAPDAAPQQPREATTPEPTLPDPAKAEPAPPEPAKAEPAKPEPAKPEPAKPATPTPEAVAVKPAQSPSDVKGDAKNDAGKDGVDDKPKMKAEKRAPVVRKGNVYVEVQGGWAEVWIGGKAIGETPLSVPLPAGRQSILLKKPSGAQKRVDVVIVPGETIRVKETL